MNIVRENIENIYALTPMQEGMLFHSLAEPNSTAYFQQMSYRLEGALDLSLLTNSWTELVRRHEILRTVFIHTGTDRPVQVVLREQNVVLNYQNLVHLSTNEQHRYLEEFKQIDLSNPFDPAAGPLMRLAVIKLQRDLWEIIWSHHHILMDGWSMGLLQEDFINVYEALHMHRVPDSRTIAPFKTFVSWLGLLNVESSRSFWSRYLGGYLESADVPSMLSSRYSGPAGKSEITFKFDARTTQGLNGLANEYQVTLNILLQSIWALLLCKYNGTTDVVFGSVVSGRPPQLTDSERMIGLFINTIPVRIRISEDATVAEVLLTTQRNALDCEEHHFLPLAEIQKTGALKGKLFSTHFSVENFPLTERLTQAGDNASGWKITHAEVKEKTHYDFDVQFLPGAELQSKLSFDTRKYCEVDARLVEGHLRNAVQWMIEKGVSKFSEVQILSSEEQLLLGKSNLPLRQYAPAKSLGEIFTAQAAKNPEAIALTFESKQLTYGDLNKRANQLAHYLIGRGIVSGSMVGICLDRSMELVISILAVAKAGGTYVPIDPAYPADRQSCMISDCGASLLITDKQHYVHFQAISGLELFILDSAQELDCCPVTNPEVLIDPQQAAYVIYTSGSTGKPKGVVVSHFNVDRLFRATQEWFHFSQTDCWTFFHSAAFDFSVWEIWGALLFGGRLVIVPYWVTRSPMDFWKLLLYERVTILNQTPSAFLQLMRVDMEDPGKRRLPLRKVIFGGEALDIQRLSPWVEKYGDNSPDLINMYGITETTVHVTYRPIRTADLQSSLGSMIGIPIPDLGMFILDANQRLVPFGVKGEIYVAGAGLATGYLNRPELTRERFPRNPVLTNAGLVYRTGDAARRFIDGEMEYLGRTDQQIKIRGFRVEPGEVEAAVNAFPEIQDSAVLMQVSSAGANILVAYFVAAPGIAVNIGELRLFLESKLPLHMVPNGLISVSALPLTEHGKVDRSRLATLQVTESHETEYAPPRNQIESLLVNAFATVLNKKRIGIHDNYFSLGGDSITAIQVLSRVLAANLKFQLKELFSHPTVAQLAPLVVSAEKVKVVERVADEALLSPMQARFLRLHPYHRNHFNHVILLNSPARLDHGNVEKALKYVCSRHPAFGLVLRRHGQEWKQIVKPFSFGVMNIDLRNVPNPTAELESSCHKLQSGFDLETGPLFKAALFRMDEGDRLFLAAHHWIIDAVSWRILLEDFQVVFDQVSKIEKVFLVDTGHSFFDWSGQLHASKSLYLEQVNYWQQVQRSPAPTVWGDLEKIDNSYGSSNREAVFFNTDETTNLLTRSVRAYNTTVEDLIITSLMRAWLSWKQTPDLVLHLENHGRDFPGLDLSRTIGWFTNLFPIAFHLHGNDLGYQIKQIKETIRNVPNSGLGYGVLRFLTNALPGKLGPELMSFNYLGRLDSAIQSGGLTFGTENTGADVPPGMQRDFYFEVSAMVVGGELELAILFPNELVSIPEIKSLLQSIKRELKAVIDHCSNNGVAQLTPSDLTYSEISLDELEGIIS